MDESSLSIGRVDVDKKAVGETGLTSLFSLTHSQYSSGVWSYHVWTHGLSSNSSLSDKYGAFTSSPRPPREFSISLDEMHTQTLCKYFMVKHVP